MRASYGTFGALTLVFAFTAPTFAASPNLSGTYTFNRTAICQPSQSFTTASKFQVSPGSAGEINTIIGTIAFTPKTAFAQTGNVSIATVGADGSLLVTTVNGSTTGSPMMATSGGETGKYSLTAKTLTITFNGETPEKLVAVYGKLDANGTAGEVEFTDVEASDPTCATSGHAQLQ